MEFRIVVAADDVNEISLVEKTGERVENLGMSSERLAQLPDALRLVGTEPELALLFAHGEAGVIGGRDGDGHEIDDVAVEDETPRLALLAARSVEVEERGELGVETAPPGAGAGLQVAAEVQVRDGEEVVRALAKAAPHSLPDAAHFTST